ncbi:DUF397 domain-containing protein [Streptomyces sp. NPDC050610]|uniref:DUF397 domain-containing protein n=1 Tax=Streptomyces sp. NPDC050610 TaxID=3157097 RepID=UPI0034496808
MIVHPERIDWIKSSYSSNNGGQCVEWSPGIASTTGVVPVRDSKNPHGPILTVSPAAWASFVGFAAHHDA